jgi:glycosyltransferase involved in cell wall biosynthesis
VKAGRIWLVVPQFDYVGGAEQHAANLAVGLAGRGFDVSVFSLRPVPADSPYHRSLRAGGVRLVDGPPRGSRWAARPDVVHVHGFRLDMTCAAEDLARTGHPVVYTEHATIGEGDDHFLPISGSEWACLKAADVVSCVSAHTREVLTAMVPSDVPVRSAGHVIREPDAVTSRPAPPGQNSPGQGKPSERMRVVCLSRMVPAKGVDVLIRAAGILAQRGTPADVVLAGDGPERQRLATLAVECGAVVSFGGGYHPDRLDVVLQGADVVVLTSYTEGLPVSVLEAFARGLPVVATAVGGTPELVVDGRNGRLVTAGDASGVADALEGLVLDWPTRQRLATGAWEAYWHGGRSRDAVIEDTLELYRTARSRRAARADSGSSSRPATSRTAATPLSQVYRSSYNWAASATSRWRNGRSR